MARVSLLEHCPTSCIVMKIALSLTAKTLTFVTLLITTSFKKSSKIWNENKHSTGTDFQFWLIWPKKQCIGTHSYHLCSSFLTLHWTLVHPHRIRISAVEVFLKAASCSIKFNLHHSFEELKEAPSHWLHVASTTALLLFFDMGTKWKRILPLRLMCWNDRTAKSFRWVFLWRAFVIHSVTLTLNEKRCNANRRGAF